MGVALHWCAGNFKRTRASKMESVGKRRRSRAAAGADNSLIADFIELRESSMVQTGPKRPRQGRGKVWFTPDPLTPLENIQHRHRRSSKSSSSTKKASTGGRKSAKKSTKPKSTEHTSTASDESPYKEFTISALTPLAHLQLNNQTRDELSTERKSSPTSKTSSIFKSSETATNDNEPAQTGATSSLTPLENLIGSQTRSKNTSKKLTSSEKRPSTSKPPATTTSTSDESAPHITPLEQLRKRRRHSKRSSVGKKSAKLDSSEAKADDQPPPHMDRSPSADTHDLVHVPTPEDHTSPSRTPPNHISPASSTSTGGEGHQSDQTSPHIKELSSQIEEQQLPPEMEEDEMIPTQSEEHEISPEMKRHDVSPLTEGHDEAFPLTEGTDSPGRGYDSGSPSAPEQLKSALKEVRIRSSLKKHAAKNSRVSFGRFVRVAEYSTDRQNKNGRSMIEEVLVDENSDRNAPSSPYIQEGSGERGEGSSSSGDRGGGNSDNVIESAESSSSPEELEPLSDGETGESEDEAPDEMELEEPLEDVKNKSTGKHRKNSVVPRALAKRKQGRGKSPRTLPRNLVKNFFMLFTKRRMTKDAMNLISKFTEVYLKQASSDVAAYTAHAGRKTIEIEDVVLLLKRQRVVSENRPFEYLVNTYLPLEYAEELLPCAVAGKDVSPQMR